MVFPAATWTALGLALPAMLLWLWPSSHAAAADEAPAWEDVCFDDFHATDGYPGEAQLKELLQPVPGRAGKISATRHHSRPICQIAGLLRLRPPWQADSVLRLALLQPNQVQLHLYAGRQGVTLRYYPHVQHTWAAYGTTRSGTGTKAESYALWAVDNGRCYRSRAGTVELRWHDGTLVMTRGDLVLLRAPLPGPPEDVFFEGTAQIRGLAMVRSQPVGPARAAARPVVRRIDGPAELDWQLKATAADSGAKLNKLPDGRVELTAQRGKQTARASATVCRPGLYEYIFEIEDAQPGTGLYLASGQGEQPYRVAFFRHRETGRTVFDLLSAGSRETERSYNFSQHVTPLAGRRQWVRLVLGAGVLRCSTSGDGVHFSEIRTDAVHAAGPCTDVGLFCLAAPQRRSIKLRSIELRRLDLLSSLADEQLVRRAGSPTGTESLEQWQQRTRESRPAGVSTEHWRRACCLRTLIDNSSGSLCQPVLHQLIEEEVLAGAGDWQSRRRLLDEAGLLVFFTNYGDSGNAPRFGEYYRRLGRELVRRGHPTPLTTVSRTVLRMPAWSIHAEPFPQELLRHELITAAQQERWQDLGRLCRRVDYWTRISEEGFYWLPWQNGREATIHLINWGRAQATREERGREKREEGGEKGEGAEQRDSQRVASHYPLPTTHSLWRHPLVERLSREGYNVYAELCEALDGQAYRAACQVITSAAAADEPGLLPDRRDRRLLVALPTAVDAAMLRWPELRPAMREHFGALGHLRVQQGMAEGDRPAVAAAARRFPATLAAAEAHRWLGDGQLSSGRAARAIGEYRRAMHQADAADRPQIAARLRLAAAMAGHHLGTPVTEPIELGQLRVAPERFEELVERAVKARAGPNAPRPDSAGPDSAGPVSTLPECPPPGRYQTRPWARIDGNPGNPAVGLPQEGFHWDWAGRRIAARFGPIIGNEGELIVNSQVNHFAFDPNSGGPRWQKRRGIEQRRLQWWTVPLRPLIVGRRIFVRWLSNKGCELVCLDAAGGKAIWSYRPEGSVVCDPVPVDGELITITVGADVGRELMLDLVVLAAETGEPLRRTPIARFHDHWSETVPCRAVLAESRLVATAGGAVLCCDLLGRPQWIRRQIWTPPPKNLAHAGRWLRQVHEAPLTADGRVWATQPGVWAVECIDGHSGRLIWRTALPELVSLSGRIGGRLIVETTEGVLALDSATGKILWRHDAEDRFDSRLYGNGEVVCYGRFEPSGESRPARSHRAALVWIDVETGRIVAQSTLDVAGNRELQLGPLLVRGGRRWVFVGSRNQAANREIRELVPAPGN